jgi:hypothetical protein
MILIYGNENEFAQMAQGATREQLYEAFKQYSQDLMDAGVLRAGGELKPTGTATTVRLREGKLTTTDGPFAETKEQLGGYYTRRAQSRRGDQMGCALSAGAIGFDRGAPAWSNSRITWQRRLTFSRRATRFPPTLSTQDRS